MPSSRTDRLPPGAQPAPLDVPRRAVTTVLPTPLQVVKLDALMMHLARHERTVAPLPEQDPQAPVALLVLYRGRPEGFLTFDTDGRHLSALAHQGLHALIGEVARAGEWPHDPRSYLQILAEHQGRQPDLQELAAMQREYGWPVSPA